MLYLCGLFFSSSSCWTLETLRWAGEFGVGSLVYMCIAISSWCVCVVSLLRWEMFLWGRLELRRRGLKQRRSLMCCLSIRGKRFRGWRIWRSKIGYDRCEYDLDGEWWYYFICCWGFYRILAQLEEDVVPCESQMENWKTNLEVMAAKEDQYIQQYKKYEVDIFFSFHFFYILLWGWDTFMAKVVFWVLLYTAKYYYHNFLSNVYFSLISIATFSLLLVVARLGLQ